MGLHQSSAYILWVLAWCYFGTPNRGNKCILTLLIGFVTVFPHWVIMSSHAMRDFYLVLLYLVLLAEDLLYSEEEKEEE